MKRYYSIREMAIREGVYWTTVADIIAKHDIPCGDHPKLPNARACDDEGYARVRAALNADCVTVPA